MSTPDDSAQERTQTEAKGARPPAAPTRRPRGAVRGLVDVLVSPQLAIALLLIVLACCLVGVTFVRGTQASELIFSTLWFNSLLVLLAVSSASAFFSRFWRRKLTVVSVGMIVFHLSFLGVLGGVVLNGLWSFRGTLRLTEGETLSVGVISNYDEAEWGRFFDVKRLRGEATLVRMHANLKIDGENKRAAYELAIRDGDRRVQDIIYATQNLEFDGLRYFNLVEGYSVLLVMLDAAGKETFGIHVPLQSHRQGENSFFYTTGTASEPGSIPFPPPPEQPSMELKLTYFPGMLERTGQVGLEVRPLGAHGGPGEAGEPKTGLVPVGGTFQAGGLTLNPREIRYWVGLNVRYDPGLTTILTSLVLGLAGMVLTLVGRVRQGSRRRAAQG